MKHFPLIIERSRDGKLWGRVQVKDNLIVESASSVEVLVRKMKKLLWNFEQIAPDNVEFRHIYDLTVLFSFKDYLNISVIAEKAGINPALMRQYASGVKFPSKERARKIEHVIHRLGKELIQVRITTGGKTSSSKGAGANRPRPAKAFKATSTV